MSLYKLEPEAQQRCIQSANELCENLLQTFNDCLMEYSNDKQGLVEMSTTIFNGLLFTLRNFMDMMPDEQRHTQTIEYIHNFLKGEFDP